jgi:hypothetical protein
MFNIPGKASNYHIKHEIEDHCADQQKFRIRLTVKHFGHCTSIISVDQVITAN